VETFQAAQRYFLILWQLTPKKMPAAYQQLAIAQQRMNQTDAADKTIKDGLVAQ
jgi:hypothetical protein